jgi:alpha-N-arabinofuranosidase
MLLQSIYYPFAMFTSRRDGVAIRPAVSGPTYESPSYGSVNYIDTSAILGDGVLHTFLVNRSVSQASEVEIDHASGKITGVQSAEILNGSDPNANNTYEHPRTLSSGPFNNVKVVDGKAILSLPPLSVAAVTFKVS